jgi:predicted outer membrane protein
MYGLRRGANVGVLIVLGSALVAILTACGREPAERHSAGTVALRDSTRETIDTVESGGEVTSDSVNAPVKERWITDANALSLLAAMNARQIAGADVELEAWHNDAVRAFAASVAREHAELQHSADSLTERMGITPLAPALAKPWLAPIQAQIDSARRAREGTIDRAFVRAQVSSDQLIADYLQQLAAAAERPELRTLLNTARTRVASQLARALALQTVLAKADSAAADSLARRAARQRKLAPVIR